MRVGDITENKARNAAKLAACDRAGEAMQKRWERKCATNRPIGMLWVKLWRDGRDYIEEFFPRCQDRTDVLHYGSERPEYGLSRITLSHELQSEWVSELSERTSEEEVRMAQ